jgi:predicted RNA binding protein YcfA (HicA-like mRNA interferase family)
VKVHELIRVIERDGWELVCQGGVQRQYWHPQKYSVVTIAGRLVDTLKPGTLSSVLRQAKLSPPRR